MGPAGIAGAFAEALEPAAELVVFDDLEELLQAVRPMLRARPQAITVTLLRARLLLPNEDRMVLLSLPIRTEQALGLLDSKGLEGEFFN